MEQVIEEILAINPNYNGELLEKAYLKAKELHEGQKRKSGEPYIIHPVAVAKILAELGMDDDTLVAGLLHDAVEDTNYTLDDVTRDFGETVAVLVDGVTKLTNIVYESSEEKQAENFRKMFLAMSKDIRILVIKLSDRLHNLRTIDYMKPEKIREKCQESLDIYAPLAARLGMYNFKMEMEDISFQHLFPEEYRKLEEQMAEREEKRSEVIDEVTEQIRQMLEALGIEFEIYGRAKQYYSIYKKMVNQRKQLDEIFDLNAVRVIVDSVRDCYAALGAIHTRWTPIPGRFKDYIAMPKPNNYQSLHTTVLDKNGKPFEVQIRTKEMHHIAEYGIAAHWKYKEGIKETDDEEVKLAWLRQSLEDQQDTKDPREFMDALKMDLFAKQVYVFTPKGELMELPAGSTPLDFAFKIHTAVGSKCVGAKVNGKIVQLDYVLRNGEIVDIITSSNSKGPSADWLKIVKTNGAKTKIRQFLRKENKPENADKGRDMLEKTAKRKGYDIQTVLKASYVLRAAKEQGYTNADELYNVISYGGPLLNKTLVMCVGYLHAETEAEFIRREKEAARKQAALSKKKQQRTNGIIVEGMDNMLIRYAKCCSPVPGDEIIGFITKGNGVSVHRKDCINILSLPDSEIPRLIEVAWDTDNDNNMYFDAELYIMSEDRKGLLADISRTMETMDISITGLYTKIDKKEKIGVSTIIMTIEISNTSDVAKVIGRLRQVDGVVDVYRTNT